MEKVKEKARIDFIHMIKKSWTWARMTDSEREGIFDMLYDSWVEKALKGSYAHRWDVLDAIYGAYLQGIGYSGCGWRETDSETPLF